MTQLRTRSRNVKLTRTGARTCAGTGLARPSRAAGGYSPGRSAATLVSMSRRPSGAGTRTAAGRGLLAQVGLLPGRDAHGDAVRVRGRAAVATVRSA